MRVESTNTKQYLVVDWTGISKKSAKQPHLYIVFGDRIFEYIDNAKNQHNKMAIYEVGRCLIDWS